MSVSRAVGAGELLECARAFLHGQRQPTTPIHIDEKLNIQLLLTMTLRLPVSEVAMIVLASQFRARALQLSRAGQFDQAEDQLAAALPMDDQLGAEATAADMSLQAAADAYCEYRQARYDRAEARLCGALENCRVLRDRFGYAIEARRIHLLRNLVRVKTFSGNYEAAFELASRTLRYVAQDGAPWPLPGLRLSSAPDTVGEPERVLLLDQLCSEVSLLLSRSRLALSMISDTEAAVGQRPTLSASAVGRLRARLAAMRAMADGDQAAFVANAQEFFLQGPGYMPESWRALSDEFLALCRQSAPEVAECLRLRSQCREDT